MLRQMRGTVRYTKMSEPRTIEYSAYRALKAELEQAKAEIESLKYELLLKPEPVKMREPDMSAVYEERIAELQAEIDKLLSKESKP